MPIGGGSSIIVQRDWAHQPWGLRITGGCDLNKPIVVVRVAAGSPAEKTLKAGDIILQIEDYDARDVRHQDALMLFQNASHQIKLVVQREGAPIPPPPLEWSADPLGVPRPRSVLDHREPVAAPLFLNTALLMDNNRPGSVSPYRQGVPGEAPDLSQQPYRTTPLVLPGAKVRREFHPNESYLRHHPNPMFRQAPPNPLITHETAMKQKVADTVLQRVEQESGPGKQISHTQFNTPIGLYSEDNIVDSIAGQTGHTMPIVYSPTSSRTWGSRASPRKTVQYDPSKSETYKALQDSELPPSTMEVTPIAPKLFSPVKARQAHPHNVPGPHSQHVMNSMGNQSAEIQQSHTFKRLMFMVNSEG